MTHGWQSGPPSPRSAAFYTTKELVFIELLVFEARAHPNTTCPHRSSHTSTHPKTTLNMPIQRRKKFKYKENKIVKPPKTSRTEMSPVMRAFVVGAITGMQGDYASQTELANTVNRTQQGISKLLQRVEQKAQTLSVNIWDEILYENDLGRGRSSLLTQGQKDRIIEVVTSSQQNREKESWQAISHGDFDEIVPKMSITTFENVMYEAGYARRRPGWKPKLTPEQEEEHYKWALAYNPNKYKEYDNQAFNFRLVVFTDETPARIGEERGMLRTWCKLEEIWDKSVKYERNRKDCCLQFYGAF